MASLSVTPGAPDRSTERSVRIRVSSPREGSVTKALVAAAALWLAWPAMAPAQTPAPTPAQVPAQMEGAHVEIRAHGFSAPTVTVKAGTTVTWINHDDDTHTVTSTVDTFRSPGLDTDETFSYTFTPLRGGRHLAGVRRG